MATNNIETRLRITGDSSDAERAIGNTIAEQDRLARELKKPLGKIGAFEDAKRGLDELDAAFLEAKKRRDDLLAANQKESAIAKEVNDAKSKLAELKSALISAKQQRDVYLNMAGESAEGAQMFGGQIKEAKQQVVDLGMAIKQQKETIAGLPKSLDAKAIREARREIGEAENSFFRAGTAASAQRETVAKLGAALQAAGVDTGRLAAEKERLAAAVLKAEKGSINLKGRLLEEQAATAAAAAETRKQTQDVAALHQEMSRGESIRETFIGYAKAAAAAFGLVKVGEFIKDSALLSARYETLGVAMHVAGNSAGYTAAQMDEAAKKLQASGISMLQSRDAALQLATAHIDLSKATQLGRAAQDLAVVANTNSSEAMARLIHGIKSGETEVLRNLGLNVSFEASYKKLAATLGISTEQLSEHQKVQARTNEALLQAVAYQGIYEESMGTAGKAMTSLVRYWENLKIKLGDAFLPTLAAGVDEVTVALKGANAEMDKLGEKGLKQSAGEGLVSFFRVLAQTVAVLGAEIKFVFNGIGNDLGGMAAQLAALSRLDFKVFSEIGRMLKDDAIQARKEQDALIDRIMNAGKESAKVSDDQKKAAEEARIAKAKEAMASQEANDKMAQGLAQGLAQTTKEAKSLNEELHALGIAPNQFEPTEKEIVQTFNRIAQDAKATGDEILTALVASLGKVSQKSAPELEWALQAAFNAGKISLGQLEAGINAVDTRAKGLWETMDHGAVKAKALEEAYKTLGVTSQASLDDTARAAKNAYDLVKASGASVVVLDAAWKSYAEKAIAANGGVATATLSQEAAMHKYAITVDEAGKAHVQAMTAALASTKALADAEKARQDALNKAKDAQIAELEKNDPAAAEAERQRQAQEALNAADIANAHATINGLHGYKEAGKYRDQAALLIKRAVDLAGQFKDTNAAEQIVNSAGFISTQAAEAAAKSQELAGYRAGGKAPDAIPMNAPAKVVNINLSLNNGKSVSVQANEGDVPGVVDFFSRLKSDMARSA